MTPADLAAYHGAWWRPGNAALVLSGQITPEAGFALAERLFGAWRASAPAPARAAASKAGPEPAPRAVVVDLPSSGQAAVVAALRSVDRKDPDYFPLLVANSVLGGGYSARLNQEIRIKRGLSYGASSSLSARKDEGLLTASTQTNNPTAPEVVELIRGELRRLAREPVGPALGTTDGVAELVSSLVTYELPLTELERYAPNVRAVTPEAIRSAVAAELKVDAPSFVVVGEASAFGAKLKGLFPNLEVVEASAVDLDSPSLR
jgi:zinc protease